jgi:hypothetical protein
MPGFPDKPRYARCQARCAEPEYAALALNVLNSTPGGEDACIIGEVRKEPANAVLVSTRYGGSRIVDMLAGDPLPRICETDRMIHLYENGILTRGTD